MAKETLGPLTAIDLDTDLSVIQAICARAAIERCEL